MGQVAGGNVHADRRPTTPGLSSGQASGDVTAQVPRALQPLVAAVVAHVQARRRRWFWAVVGLLLGAWMALAFYWGAGTW